MSEKKYKIKVTQTGSAAGRNKKQRATLIGLGLNKIGRQVELYLTPEVKGQVTAVKHLVQVENI